MSRIDNLQKDKRGYPIPIIVKRDAEGKPHFTINDAEIVTQVAWRNACHICGEPLGVHKWFVGGAGSALHPNGRYFDCPLHKECGEFALRTCPHLALAGKYKRPIEGRGYKDDDVIVVDQTVIKGQPAVFVFADTTRYVRNNRGHFIPERPWRAVEFWRGGKVITDAEARELVQADPILPVPFNTLTWWPK